MIPTDEKCYDGGEHKWLSLERDTDRPGIVWRVWCPECGSLALREVGEEAFDIDVPTCHKEFQQPLKGDKE